MASSRPAQKPLDLEITIVSAKNLKNVNWRHGELKAYAVFWLDVDRRVATKPDDNGSTRPIWNEQCSLPITNPISDSLLTIEIFHSKPSETAKPLVSTLRAPLKDLLSGEFDTFAGNLELRRPSGRPQGKIRVKLAVKERPLPPTPSEYHPLAPRDIPASFNRDYSPSPPYAHGVYSNPYGYYAPYYQPSYYQPPPPRPPAFFDRAASSYGGPSAPIDCSPGYDHIQRPKSGKTDVNAVSGSLGGLGLDEEEDKIAGRVERSMSMRSDFGHYPPDY